MRVRIRGFALFLTLIITSLLIMLLTATIFSARGGSVFSQDYHAKKAAYYAAETGLAILQQRLEADPTYDDSTSEDTPYGSARFTINFGSDGCVNNLEGTDPIAGPLGDVPAGSAFIRIEGEALGHTETIECMLGRKDSDFIYAAVVASGRVSFDGDISITGRDSNDLLSRTPADVISNYQEDHGGGRPPLYYNQDPGESARIEGTVRSASPSNNAISSDLQAAADEALTDQTPVPLQNFDIIGEVRSKTGHPSPPASTGAISGTYYQNGNYTVPGDLVLDDADLYIQGDLTVIGSITGRGKVFVTGATTFSGDSMVTANEDGIALYSNGNVALTGFNGSQYMEALTASAGGQAPEQWRQTQHNIGTVVDFIRSGDDSHFQIRSTLGATPYENLWSSDVGVVLAFLGHTVNQSIIDHPNPLNSGPDLENALFDLRALVEAQTNSPAQEFMLEKLTALRSGPQTVPFDPARGRTDNVPGALGITYNSTSPIEVQKIRDFLDHGTISDGLFQKLTWVKSSRVEIPGADYGYGSLSDQEIDLAVRKMSNWLENMSYDKLGSSYFQGAIYTRGALYAANEVTIIGSVAAVADPRTEDSITDFRPAPGVELRPGDLHLGNGTTITFVSDIIPGSEPDGVRVGVSYWLR